MDLRGARARSSSNLRRRLWLGGLLIASLLLLASCSNLGYVGQAAWGQGRILLQRQAISRLLQDAGTPEQLKVQLRRVERIREFASEHLGLPTGGSYRSYVELPPASDGGRRSAVVWNVVAAPELSTVPLTWCFPVAGCVSYRGYFSERRARRFGDRLKARGYDVSIGGAAAYSTLGWFEDPVLSTVIDYPEPYLAGLIFHELAHQQVYVQDDTRFNESFATAVEIEGIRRWLQAGGQSQTLLADYLVQQQERKEVTALLLDARTQLQDVFDQPQDEEWKRKRKQEVMTELQSALLALERSRAVEGGTSAGRWGARLLNNADLVSAADYHGLVDDFRRLLERQGGDLEAFYGAVRELAELPASERVRRLSIEMPEPEP